MIRRLLRALVDARYAADIAALSQQITRRTEQRDNALADKEEAMRRLIAAEKTLQVYRAMRALGPPAGRYVVLELVDGEPLDGQTVTVLPDLVMAQDHRAELVLTDDDGVYRVFELVEVPHE